jgi:hypothetical protein
MIRMSRIRNGEDGGVEVSQALPAACEAAFVSMVLGASNPHLFVRK